MQEAKKEYNHLDLPRRIDGPGGITNFTYDATGRKWLQKTEKNAIMYVGALTFKKENGNGYLLEAANIGDGRIVYDKDNQQLFTEYFHKDHLGNIRLAFTDRNEDGKVELLGSASEITQQNDFYPFGMAHKGEGLFHGDLGGNRFKFNGIEQLEDIGLELAPFRSYDAAVGRWGQVDPIYKFNESGYASMTNNPINFADPMGLDTIPDGEMLPIVPVPGKRERSGPLPQAEISPQSDGSSNTSTPSASPSPDSDSESGSLWDLAFQGGSGFKKFADGLGSPFIDDDIKPFDGYGGVDVSFALLGGFGFGFGRVCDGEKCSSYFNVYATLGLGANLGFEGGSITPTGNGEFDKINIFEGGFTSYEGGLGVLGYTRGGNISLGTTGVNRFTEFGDQYTIGGGGLGAGQGIKLRPKLSGSIMAKTGYTWVF